MRRGALRRALAAWLPVLCAVVATAAVAAPRCDDHNPLRNLYAGDLHVHTALSLDAATQDTRARPADAYRFARGEPLGIQPFDADGNALRTRQLARPLDFAAVTDHAELLGEVELCRTPGSAAWDTWQCAVYRHWPRGAYYLFNYRASSAKRLGLCGPDGALCREAAAGPWAEIRAAAEDAYDRSSACRFTSFLGYEWTGSVDTGKNLHRNVIFRGSTAPRIPVGFVDTGAPEKLWEALDTACAALGPDCDWLAIPHNANLSAGRMFLAQGADGRPYDRADAALRARAEPLLEIVQHKGVSECAQGPGATAIDEECAFEQLPYDSFSGQNLPWLREAPRHGTGYLRDALREGLRLEAALGVDPFRVGVIGSTDTHLGIAGDTSEAAFPGHGGAGEPARDGAPAGLPDAPEFNPGGLAMVWAEENTRESIFDALRRRETYATSGTRTRLRVFAGWDYPASLCEDPALVAQGYAGGVPMGGELRPPAGADAAQGPVFVVAAERDVLEGQGLGELQIVKGWVEPDGSPGEEVVVLERRADALSGSDPASCAPATTGADRLCSVWRDPAWRPGARAWYYARVLETPSCRWSQRVCVARGVRCEDPSTVGPGLEACCDGSAPALVRERAWSSPVWVLPPAAEG